jgi:hypothetical protein
VNARLGAEVIEEPESRSEVDRREGRDHGRPGGSGRGMVHARAGRGASPEAAAKALKVALATRPWPSTQPACGHRGSLPGPQANLKSRAGSSRSRSELEKQAKLACKAARAFGAIFPIGQPYAALFQGIYEQLAGKPSAAREALEKCVELSRKLAMPYEEGRALLELRPRRSRP